MSLDRSAGVTPSPAPGLGAEHVLRVPLAEQQRARARADATATRRLAEQLRSAPTANFQAVLETALLDVAAHAVQATMKLHRTSAISGDAAAITGNLAALATALSTAELTAVVIQTGGRTGQV